MEAREEASWEGTRRAKGHVGLEGRVEGWWEAKGHVGGGVVDLGDVGGEDGDGMVVESGLGVEACIVGAGEMGGRGSLLVMR